MRALTSLLHVVAMAMTFLAGAATVAGTARAAPQALILARWATTQASNSLLLDQGPFTTYLLLSCATDCLARHTGKYAEFAV
jgi:hypothetical protein